MLVKGHHKATFFRHEAKAQVSKATTSMIKDKTCNYDMCDWTPVAWHMKGYTLLVISLYLDANGSLLEGINCRKLTSLAAFIKSACFASSLERRRIDWFRRHFRKYRHTEHLRIHLP